MTKKPDQLKAFFSFLCLFFVFVFLCEFLPGRILSVMSYMIYVFFFPLKGKRTLSLLVENCGRVNYGKTLDEQRKGTNCLANRWLCRCSVFLFFLHSKKLINSVLRSTRKTLTYLSGLVGDIELNKHVLRDFIIHSLGMKPGFVNRFVSFNYNVVSFHVCVSLSLHLPAPDSIQLIISLLNPITAGT